MKVVSADSVLSADALIAPTRRVKRSASWSWACAAMLASDNAGAAASRTGKRERRRAAWVMGGSRGAGGSDYSGRAVHRP